MGRYGAGIAQALRARDCRVQSVDYNPELVRSGDAMGHPVLYGDAEDPEFIASLPLTHAQWVISTTRERHVNQSLIHTLLDLGYTGRIAVTADSAAEADRLKQAGADLVMVPYADAASDAASQLLQASSAEKS